MSCCSFDEPHGWLVADEVGCTDEPSILVGDGMMESWVLLDPTNDRFDMFGV